MHITAASAVVMCLGAFLSASDPRFVPGLLLSQR